MRNNGRTDRVWRGLGFALMIVGLGWIIASTLLRNYFPLRWGGPNIGGGLLVLLAALAGVTGLVLVVVDMALDRQDRGMRISAANWVGLVVTALLAVTLVVVEVVQPGDPSAGIDGQVGVTVSAGGSPVLVLQICTGSIDQVTIYGPSRGATPNEKLARFHSGRPANGTVLFDLTQPPDGWTAEPGSTLSTADPAKLKIADGNGPRNELRQVDFVDADLASLDSTTVLYSGFDGRQSVRKYMKLADFRAYACR